MLGVQGEIGAKFVTFKQKIVRCKSYRVYVNVRNDDIWDKYGYLRVR